MLLTSMCDEMPEGNSIETTTDRSFILHNEGVGHMRLVLKQTRIHYREKGTVPQIKLLQRFFQEHLELLKIQ